LGLELGRGGARWIDRSVDGSMHPRGRECNRRSGRNSRSSRAIERRDDDDGRRARARSTTHRTPAAASPGLSRPRGASARRTSRRGRAPDGRARARGARMRRRRGETSLVSRSAVAAPRGRCARVATTRREEQNELGGPAERRGTARAHAARVERRRRARRSFPSPRRLERVAVSRASAVGVGPRAPDRRSSIVPAADRSVRWPPRRREEERRNPIRSTGWRPRRSRARRRDGRPPRAIPRASRRERPQAPRLRPRRVFARRTSPAARSEAARRRPTRADSDSHPRRRPTSSASSSACAARAWTCTTLGSSTCARAKPRSESRSCSGISPGRGTTSTETARRDTLVRSR